MAHSSIALSYCPSVSELLALPVFRGSRLLGGGAGLERPVSGVNLSDTPEYFNWICAGELMVTTCFAIHGDSAALENFVPVLATGGMAGVCIKPGQYLGQIPQAMVDQAESLNLPLVELPEHVRFSDITKAVSDEFLRRQTALLHSVITVNEVLIRTIVEGASLGEIAGMVCDMLGGSILILDIINDRRALHLTEHDAAGFSGLGSEEVCATVIARAQMYALDVGGRSFGFLYVYGAEDPLPERDESVLAQVLQAIPLEISRERTVRESGNRLLDDFILHLLSDQITDEGREYARADGLGLDLRENHLVIRARLEERGDLSNQYTGVFQRTLLLDEMRSTAANLGFSLCKVRAGDEHLFILSSPLDNRAFIAVAERFPEIAKRFSLEYTALRITAGVGRHHPGIGGLRQSDSEARVALKAAAGGEGLLMFNQLGFLRLVYASDPDQEVDAFVHETLGRLIEPEQTRTHELLSTLESYFHNFGNLKRVSEELFTHYNTVAYRIKSIQELTGVDLHDADQRLLLELALSLYLKRRFLSDRSCP